LSITSSASTQTETVNSTKRCTSSSSPDAESTQTPAPRSNAALPKADPRRSPPVPQTLRRPQHLANPRKPANSP
jgi:hypothetical protein